MRNLVIYDLRQHHPARMLAEVVDGNRMRLQKQLAFPLPSRSIQSVMLLAIQPRHSFARTGTAISTRNWTPATTPTKNLSSARHAYLKNNCPAIVHRYVTASSFQ